MEHEKKIKRVIKKRWILFISDKMLMKLPLESIVKTIIQRLLFNI